MGAALLAPMVSEKQSSLFACKVMPGFIIFSEGPFFCVVVSTQVLTKVRSLERCGVAISKITVEGDAWREQGRLVVLENLAPGRGTWQPCEPFQQAAYGFYTYQVNERGILSQLDRLDTRGRRLVLDYWMSDQAWYTTLDPIKYYHYQAWRFAE
jgi:hypothetical protein